MSSFHGPLPGRRFPNWKWFSQTILPASSDGIADVTSSRSPGLRVSRTPRRPCADSRSPSGALPAAGERADIIVAQDGSGDFRAVQPALDAIPRDNAANRIILVRNGVYREKLFITASHVSIVGEDRDATRIEYAELRKIWRETHPNDYGAAVINIADDVTDLVLANLTVRNDYGLTHDEHDHQFAIRSGGNATRISILHAKVVADGGDTLSLWNPASGMYYHSDCDFEGWVDYVCPRGWAYITNSRFFGHNLTASIWHDGSKDPDSKFVIRRSRFDGVKDFPLGRNNRDGQFFLLDSRFSANMADRPIYRPSAPETYLFPARYYYSGQPPRRRRLPLVRGQPGDGRHRAASARRDGALDVRREVGSGRPRCRRCSRSPACRGQRTGIRT